MMVIFVLSGVNKFMDPSGSEAYMAAKGMPMVPFFLYAAAVLEVLGGLMIVFGYHARIAAAALFIYLIPVTYLFHDFWNATAAAQQVQMLFFLKNLAIMGGLLYVVSSGAGGWSFDACCNPKKPEA